MDAEAQLKIARDEIEELNATLGKYVSESKRFEERIGELKNKIRTLEKENNRLNLLLGNDIVKLE